MKIPKKQLKPPNKKIMTSSSKLMKINKRLQLRISEIQQTEKVLLESEKAYQTIFENTGTAIVLIEENTVISLANKEFEQLSGYSKQEIEGKKRWLDFVIKEDLKWMRIQLQLRQKELKAALNYYEFRFIDRSQKIHNIYLTIDIIPGTKRSIASLLDITERKRAEEMLRESEEKYKYIFDHSVVGETITLPSGEINSNKALSNMLGYSEEEINKLNWQDITYPDDIELTQEALQSLFSGEKDSAHFIKRYIHKNGSIVWGEVSTSLRRDKEEQPMYFMTNVVNITERKLTEEALKNSEQHNKIIAEMTMDYVFIVDVDYQHNLKLRWTSENLVQVTGRTISEAATSDLWKQIIHPENVGNFFKFVEQILTTIKSGEIECRTITKFGTERWIHIFAKPKTDEHNQVITIIGAVKDITERKRAEEELTALTLRQQAILAAVPDIIMEVDNNKIYTWANKAGLDFFGNAVIGKEASYYFEGDQDSYNVVQPLFNGDKDIIYIESWQRRKDGEKRLLAWWCRVLKDRSGNVTGTLFSARDITEQRQVGDALRESEERMRAIVEGTPHLFFYTQDVDANTTYVSPTVEQITGYKTDIWIKRKDWFITAAEFNQVAKEKTQAHLRGEFTKEPVILEVCHANGSRILLEAYEYPIMQKGKIVGLQGVAHDITERRQAEEALRQMQKLEELGTLAGGIAHDFNNILGIILAYNENIKQFKDDTKQLDLATETITKAVDRGKTLVQSILTFARKTETAFGPVNVNEVVMEIMAMILETFPKILTYSQNFDKAVPYINADRSQLHQALLNLCVNARDAMPKAGILTINTRMVSVASLHNQHPDAAASNYVCIEVSDTGEGMSEEIRKRIFEPFFTTKGIGKGTGLGLSVVFGVIQSHKGFIDVDSQIGKGTTFRLYLPALQIAEPIIEKEKETSESIPGGTETLLVVEDEEMLLMSLRMVLVEKGYKVISAGDGQTALKIYQERKDDIALVLTDLGLPNISGLEVCQRIKTINPNERMILVSGFLDPEMKAEFLNAGIQHFLYKPYDLTKVLKEVREVLDKK
jgi:two-component system cell cycle sensor histidine kinase/response regulator CckA